MQSTTLDNMFSSSASILMIMRLYQTKPIMIGKAIGVDPIEVTRWKLGLKHMGAEGYLKLIEVYPEFRHRIDWNGKYKGYRQ